MGRRSRASERFHPPAGGGCQGEGTGHQRDLSVTKSKTMVLFRDLYGAHASEGKRVQGPGRVRRGVLREETFGIMRLPKIPDIANKDVAYPASTDDKPFNSRMLGSQFLRAWFVKKEATPMNTIIKIFRLNNCFQTTLYLSFLFIVASIDLLPADIGRLPRRNQVIVTAKPNAP